MFKFESDLNSGEEMSENPRVRYHANQVIRTLNKIIIVISRSQFDSDSNSCIALLQDQERLFEQGERHYHYGLKIEHFTVFENCFIKSLEESLKINTFHEKYEISWRKLIRYIFKQFTDGMKFEKKEELKLEKQKSIEKKKLWKNKRLWKNKLV
jgi:hypothetical protein